MFGGELKGPGTEKFDDTDFGYWKMQIEDYLYGKKLHLLLLGKCVDNMDEDEWNLLDAQLLGVIRLTLSRSVAHNVIKEKTDGGIDVNYILLIDGGEPIDENLNKWALAVKDEMFLGKINEGRNPTDILTITTDELELCSTSIDLLARRRG